MKHTKREILDALNVIKSECEATASCQVCPFRDETGCALYHMRPEDWEITEEEPEVWRAFK